MEGDLTAAVEEYCEQITQKLADYESLQREHEALRILFLLAIKKNGGSISFTVAELVDFDLEDYILARTDNRILGQVTYAIDRST